MERGWGRGRDDQRLQGKGRGGRASRQRVAKNVFCREPRPCERAEAATKTSWESREGLSSGGRGNGQGQRR